MLKAGLSAVTVATAFSMLGGVASADISISTQTVDTTRYTSNPYGTLVSSEGTQVMGLRAGNCELAGGIMTAVKDASVYGASSGLAAADIGNVFSCGPVQGVNTLGGYAVSANGRTAAGQNGTTIIVHR